jgi:hypothetical protein
MKNHLRILLLFLAFMFCFITIKAQRNTAYLSLSLPDRGLGFRYDRELIREQQTNSIGLFVGANKGKYQTWYKRGLNHVKIVCGVTYYVHTPGSSYTNLFIAGLNYNFYSRELELDNKVYFPVSFDIGTGMRFKRISVLMTYDILKKDASINLGYNF